MSKLNSAPTILVMPSTQTQGVEFADASISLSNRYSRAILDAGGLPVIMPCELSKELVREYVRRCDGVVLTGGDDVQTKFFAPKISKKLQALVKDTEPERDLVEFILVDEVFRQRKPLLGICRGHQMLNVALGGTLVVDIPTQMPKALNHRRMDSKCDPVHDVDVVAGTEFAAIMKEKTFAVNSTHHQAVGRLAKALKVTARSADGIVEAMELKDARQLPFLQTVQFHPERLYDRYPVFRGLFLRFVEVCRLTNNAKT